MYTSTLPHLPDSPFRFFKGLVPRLDMVVESGLGLVCLLTTIITTSAHMQVHMHVQANEKAVQCWASMSRLYGALVLHVIPNLTH